MTCGECGHESPEGANFCESCGARLPADPAPPSPEEAAQALLDQGVNPALVEQLQAIQTALDTLRADIGQHADRLQLVERILNAPRIDPAPPPTPLRRRFLPMLLWLDRPLLPRPRLPGRRHPIPSGLGRLFNKWNAY